MHIKIEEKRKDYTVFYQKHLWVALQKGINFTTILGY